MISLIVRSLAVLLLIGSTMIALAQDLPELEAFSDPTYSVEGLRPVGWSPVGPGLLGRQNDPTDVALIGVQSAPLSPDVLWQALLPQFGLDSAPEPVGSYETAAFDWTLYQFDLTVRGLDLRFDLSLAESDGTTYLVLLQASADEYETLHDAVFQPVLDSVVPIVEDAPPYHVEEVEFESDGVTLAGTLTRPDVPGQHPAVVLMSGTGPQTRDELVVPGFPIFRLIADYLTQQGIAVLRYDDRGVGQSGGDYDSTSIYDFAADGQAAVDYLKTRDDINAAQVGLLGHSEGGVYAALIGSMPDSGVAFIISMAGTASSGEELLSRQNELILATSGADDEAVQSQLDYLASIYPLIAERDWEAVRALSYERSLALWESLSEEERLSAGADDAESFAERSANAFITNYGNESFVTMLEYDSAEGWAETTAPVLGVFGELDVQVDPIQNAGPMADALAAAGNEDFEIVVIEGANHLFQAAETGALDEYVRLPAMFTDEFLPLIGDWILARVDTVVD